MKNQKTESKHVVQRFDHAIADKRTIASNHHREYKSELKNIEYFKHLHLHTVVP